MSVAAILGVGAAGLFVYVVAFLPDPWSILVSQLRFLGRRGADASQFAPEEPVDPVGQPISVVVPCRNEAESIVANIGAVFARLEGPVASVDVVVVDGNSSDGTADRVRAATFPGAVRCVDYAGRNGRGGALARGVAEARGGLILMLHADTTLPRGWDAMLRRLLAAPDTLLTFFDFAVDLERVPESVARRLRSTSLFANLRSRWLWLPYGDQAIAARRNVLEQLGGVPELPLMEDFVLVSTARRAALRSGCALRPVGAAARCSPRRWLAQSPGRVTALNWLICFCYVVLGTEPTVLARWYYGKG